MTKIQITPKWSEVKPEGFYVYLHRRLTDGVVFYVGKGKGRRGWATCDRRNNYWSNVFLKHGAAIEIVMQNMREPCAHTLEKILIEKHESENLTNLSTGGEGSSGAGLVPVYCSNGMVFKSVTSAVDWLRHNGHERASTGAISMAASGKMGTSYGFTWSYDGRCREYVSPRCRQAATISTKVYCSNGMEFQSFMDAERWLIENGFPKADKVNIRNCCNGKYRSAYGLSWSRSKEVGEYIDPKKRSGMSQSKSVVRSDGEVFDSVSDAATSVRGRASSVSRVCRGERLTYRGLGGHLISDPQCGKYIYRWFNYTECRECLITK